MKGNASKIITIIVLIIIALFGVSRYQKSKAHRNLAKQISAVGSENSPVTVEDLRAAIAAHEKQIELYVETAARTGLYWKILASRLQDRGLHGEALEALQRAIYYLPEDAALHYNTGISAGILAKSFHAFPGMENPERQRYYDLAEQAFLRAIGLDSRYLRPRYSLGVLYVFELDRPEDAIPHLEKCLEISRSDIDTMFVLARAFFMIRDFQAAVDLYDRIIIICGDERRRNEAQENRQFTLGQMNG